MGIFKVRLSNVRVFLEAESVSVTSYKLTSHQLIMLTCSGSVD